MEVALPVGPVVGAVPVGVHGHRDLQRRRAAGRRLRSRSRSRSVTRRVRTATARCRAVPAARCRRRRRARVPLRAAALSVGSWAFHTSACATGSPHRSCGARSPGRRPRRAERVEGPAERRGGEEHPRLARRVLHRPVAAHRQPGDRALVPRVPVPLEQLAQLDEVEGLPLRRPTRAAVPPVRVEPTPSAPASGMTTSRSVGAVSVSTSVFCVQSVYVAGATIEQVQHGPAGGGLRVEPSSGRSSRTCDDPERRPRGPVTRSSGPGCGRQPW